MYSIAVMAPAGLVEVTLGGLMTVEEVVNYIRDLKAAFVRHRLRSYAFILDVAACPIQQQDMLQSMGAHMVTMPKARAIAVVTGSSLARMQIRRLFIQPYARITTNMADARAWVLDGIEPPNSAVMSSGQL